MKSLSQITRLIGVSSRVAEEPEDDHRVLTLFRNRAELKKAYGELQEEVFRLKDRIKQQEGATARVQEMLGGLETRLGLVETAYPALVFYQLRSLWQRCRDILEQFTAELAAAQEERERRQILAEFNRSRFARRQQAEAALGAAQVQCTGAEQFVAGLRARRTTLTRFWHYFRRRDLDRRLQGALAAVAQATATRAQAQTALEEFAAETLPEFPGLSVEARRAINLAVIAYAEVLCLRLADTQLVKLAKEATARREPVDEYGTRAECEALIALIARARDLIDQKRNLAQDLKARVPQLRKTASYREPTETSPTAESVAPGEGDVLAGRRLEGLIAARMPNVLGEDIWDLFRVLLR